MSDEEFVHYDKTDYLEAMAKSADYLGRRDHSEHELRTKLRRNFHPRLVELVLLELKERGWILPPEELAQKVGRQQGDKNRGIHRINAYLRQKGLPPVEANEDDEKEKARQLLLTKFRKTKNLSFDERKKAYNYLHYRGFSGDIIRSVINE